MQEVCDMARFGIVAWKIIYFQILTRVFCFVPLLSFILLRALRLTDQYMKGAVQ